MPDEMIEAFRHNVAESQRALARLDALGSVPQTTPQGQQVIHKMSVVAERVAELHEHLDALEASL